jgi:hypothetical protein
VPVAPYTWQLNDYLTASRLNGELYCVGGQQFTPNGIGFHAAKPLYKAAPIGSYAPSISASTWFAMGSVLPARYYQWAVQGDTGGFFGARSDAPSDACISFQQLASGGGSLTGAAGGLALAFAFNPVTSGGTNGATRLVAGLGAVGGGSPSTVGTSQLANATYPTCAYAADIVDLNPGGTSAVTSWLFSSQAAPATVVNRSDGSGLCPRIGAQWASVYTANGATAGSLPAPQATWTSSSPFTAALMNGAAGIKQLMTMLNMPPLLRVASSGTTSCANTTTTTITYPAATYDTYSAWNSGTSTYTVPLSGLYLVYHCVPWAAQSASARSGISVNGNAIWGPNYPAGITQVLATAKVQILSLTAGDTIQPIALQQSGGALNAGSGAIFLALYLGQAGAPGALPTLPDITYRWMAGTPSASMPGLLNSHLANDLLYLAQKPYVLTYQATAQTGIAMSTSTYVTEDTVQGIVHGDAGDPWSGWTSGASNAWTAPRSGWYLVCQETMMAAPGLSAGVNTAGFICSQPGLLAYDSYQAATSNVTAGAACGAAGLNYYYLRAGDSIAPQISTVGTSATTTATYVNATAFNSHFEAVWVGA